MFASAFGILFLSVSFAQALLPGFFTILPAITCFQSVFFGSFAISGSDAFSFMIVASPARTHPVGIFASLGWAPVQRASVLSGAATFRAVSLHGAKAP